MLLSDISIKRPVFTTMVILAILVFGFVSYTRIGIDMMPEVDFPLVTVLTIYPGADPETVEQEVSKKIEDSISTINGVRSLRSISVDNVSQVIIEFELELDVDQVVQDVRDKVAAVLPELPDDVETPKVQKLDLGAIPILNISVGGPGTIGEVTSLARKRIKEPLQSIPGVGTVNIVGGREREIKVWLDPDRLDAMGLTVQEVIGALSANNLDFPGGRLEAGNTEFAVKVNGRFSSLAEIEQLKIMEMHGRAIRIMDVARVEDGLEERRSAARLSGENAIVLVVRKQSGTNSVQVADLVKARLQEISATFPPGYRAFVAIDNTTFTKTSIEDVQFDMLFGAFLAVLIVFLFLRNWRSTIIAALAIPTSVVGTFMFIRLLGFTFNTMTMLALSLSIGLLIDDAIVVIENIYRHMESGAPPIKAAASGTGEIGLAVMATTMSIVAVFIPVAFTQGMIGRIFYQFGTTVAVAVLISLFVSFTLTPMLSSRFLAPAGRNRFYASIEKVLAWLDRIYRSVIAAALRHRLATVVLALSVFAGAIFLARMIPTSFIPPFDQSRLNVVVKTPVGTNLARTEELAEQLAARVRAHRDLVVGTVAMVGADTQKKQNLAKIYVKLLPKEERALSQMGAMDLLRKEFSDFPEAVVSVEEVPMFGGETGMRAATIQFNVRGGDLSELSQVSARLADALARAPGFVDVDTTWETGKPEVRVQMDRERAAALGVVTAAVGQAVYALVGGVEASKFRQAGDDVPIRVRLAPSARQEATQIGRLKVRPAGGGKPVALANLAKIVPSSGPIEIDRQARRRQITVLANLEEGVALGPAMDQVRTLAAKIVPAHLETDFEGQAKIAKESMGNLLVSLVLAIIMIYLLLASQFESFLHPLTIMMSLPLAMVGAFLAMLISGDFLSIIAMIGIIMLMGLVTKNAILLIDYTNTLRRRDGLGRTEALLKAGPTRLRPILMTTAAMVFGMLPIALSRGQGSEMRAPMAVAVIGGLLVSTLLTLVVVPVVYSLLDDLAGGLKRLARGRRSASFRNDEET
ncbi:MAG TPA: efflux RND transporter permease subunit [Myxococcota bacterium]|nr:efflux RND transporter permease subunit [Myxococcota bacterium]